MRWSLSRLRPLHLVAISALYWIGLAAVKLGGAMLAAWWISRLPPGHGSASAGSQNTLLYLRFAQDGTPIWSGQVSVVALLAMVVGPPLLLALTWRWSREAVGVAGEDGAVEENVAAESERHFPAPSPPWQAEPKAGGETTRVVDPRRAGPEK